MHVNVITFFIEKEISQLPKDSTKLFKTNKVDLCIYRPNHVYASRKYAVLDSFCYAEFLRYYYLSSTKDNYYQPEEITEELLENNCTVEQKLPMFITLVSPK